MEKKRLYSTTNEISREDLVAAFAGTGLVTCAVLFGSRAQGRATTRSDYDVAVSFSRAARAEAWGANAALRNYLVPLLGLDDIDVDLVELERVDAAVVESIREGFIILKGTDDEIRKLLDRHEVSRGSGKSDP